MKKFIGKFVLKVCRYTALLALGYMFYTKDFTYINIVDIWYIAILGVTTVVLPLLFLMFATGISKRDERIIGSLKSYEGTLFKSKIKIVFSYAFVVLATVLLALTQHTFLVVWYVLVTFTTIKFNKWCKEKVANLEEEVL